MIIDNNNWRSPVRKLSARVESFLGSTPVEAFTGSDRLKSFSIDRVGDNSKFFGYGICQKANIRLVDKDREKDFTTSHRFKCYVKADGDFTSTFPIFKTTEVHRDEKTNELSITAYDALYPATEHYASELNLLPPYTIKNVAEACATLLGISVIEIIGVDDGSFDTEYPEGANAEGTETIRETLDAIAEATQTIYYIDSEEKLVFKRLDRDGAAVLIITKEDYIDLKSKTNRRLSDICVVSELGDNITTTSGLIGTTQYVRENPFWDIRDDIIELLEKALNAVKGLTIGQFECSWRGNVALELGDKIAMITKDNEECISYLTNDIFTYNGSMSQKTKWEYGSNDSETASNPTSLGEVVKQTYARVDKANQEIRIIAGEVASLTINTDEINASITDLEKKVEATMTSDEVKLAIQEQLAEGVDSVTTETGFTFNADGLTINKSDSETNTQITENGLTINNNGNGDTLLTVDKDGVKAKNLHATTFLIVGENSRFEDYEYNNEARTGCFWIRM